MTDTIDADRALAIIERVAEIRGEDYVYTAHYDACQYVWPSGDLGDQIHDIDELEVEDLLAADLQPACVIGVGLVDANLATLKELALYLDTSVGGLFGLAVRPAPYWAKSANMEEFVAEVRVSAVAEKTLDEASEYEWTREPLDVEITPDALRIFTVAQIAQDRGEPMSVVRQVARMMAETVDA